VVLLSRTNVREGGLKERARSSGNRKSSREQERGTRGGNLGQLERLTRNGGQGMERSVGGISQGRGGGYSFGRESEKRGGDARIPHSTSFVTEGLTDT